MTRLSVLTDRTGWREGFAVRFGGDLNRFLGAETAGDGLTGEIGADGPVDAVHTEPFRMNR
jgi:hypothetical protein